MMKSQVLKQGRFVRLEEFSELSGITKNAIGSMSKRNGAYHDYLVSKGFLKEEKGKWKTFNTVIIPFIKARSGMRYANKRIVNAIEDALKCDCIIQQDDLFSKPQDDVNSHKDDIKMTSSEWYEKFLHYIDNNSCWFGVPMIEMIRCAFILSKVQEQNFIDKYSEIPEMIDNRLDDILQDIYRESARAFLNMFDESLKN